MQYILIVMFIGGGGGTQYITNVKFQEFDGRVACEQARQVITNSNGVPRSLKAVCSLKG